MIMSKSPPAAWITVAVLKDTAGDAAPTEDRGGRYAGRVPPEAVKAFWKKVRRHAR
jgi:hypothetical protein